MMRRPEANGLRFNSAYPISRMTGHVVLSGFHFSGKCVNQDPAHEIAGLEYLFANKKDFGGDDNARQKLGSVLI
jgi:hypothetical protein